MKVVILGATGDLGRTLADRFADDDIQLVLHGLSEETLAALALRHPGALTAACDIRNEAEVERLFAHVGSFDGLVYAIGVNPITETVETTDLDVWNEILSVNLTGAFLALKYALPILRKSDRASVVLVSSIFGLETSERRVAYGASKHALTALVQGIAREERGAVRINAICPGPMWSEILRNIFYKHAMAANITLEEYVYRRVEEIPMGRFLELDECADAVKYLISPQSSFINGESIRVTGGAIR